MKEVHGWEVWFEGQEAKRVFYPENRQAPGIIACELDASCHHRRVCNEYKLSVFCVAVTKHIKVENVFTSNTAPAPAEKKEATPVPKKK